jgi:hypothetical protein
MGRKTNFAIRKVNARDDLDRLRAELDVLRSKVHAAKVAYLNRTPLDGKVPTFEHLKDVAAQYIRASYAYQKAYFGAVKVRISVAKLLR